MLLALGWGIVRCHQSHLLKESKLWWLVEHGEIPMCKYLRIRNQMSNIYLCFLELEMTSQTPWGTEVSLFQNQLLYLILPPTPVHSRKTHSVGEHGVPMGKMERSVISWDSIESSNFPFCGTCCVFQSGRADRTVRVKFPPFHAVVLSLTVQHSPLERLSINTVALPQIQCVGISTGSTWTSVCVGTLDWQPPEVSLNGGCPRENPGITEAHRLWSKIGPGLTRTCAGAQLHTWEKTLPLAPSVSSL